jgi:hypothetical protein
MAALTFLRRIGELNATEKVSQETATTSWSITRHSSGRNWCVDLL